MFYFIFFFLFFFIVLLRMCVNIYLVDDMGKRLDELESSIGELMTQAGIDEDQGKGQGGD